MIEMTNIIVSGLNIHLWGNVKAVLASPDHAGWCRSGYLYKWLPASQSFCLSASQPDLLYVQGFRK